MVWDPKSSDYGSFHSQSTSPSPGDEDRSLSRRGISGGGISGIGGGGISGAGGLALSASPTPTASLGASPSKLAPPLAANVNMRVTDLYQSQPLLPAGPAEVMLRLYEGRNISLQ